MVLSEKDPIIARASAAGRGGIGIVRISGERVSVESIIAKLLPGKSLQPRHAHLVAINDRDGELLDQAIVIYYEAPRSYTGEAVLEIQAHGGMAVQKLILERCLDVGKNVHLRMAQPGEFSQRAFLNGRMDLTQAEAVADLIDASNNVSARAAARSMQGAFSRRVNELNDQLIDLRAFLEATLDFPEEEIDFIESGHVNERVTALIDSLQALQKSAMRGKVLRDGLTIVLVGSPNVGKSSLMNALAGEEVAIVTEIAGTTRDRIERQIDLGGLVINLIDTAGVRSTNDPVEAIGVQRTLQAVSGADIVLHLRAANISTDGDDQALELIRPCLREGVQFLTVLNKIDLPHETPDTDVIAVSAKTGTGIDSLVNRLQDIAGGVDDAEGEFLARTRHLDCLARAYEHLKMMQSGVLSFGLDLAAEELRLASQALGEIVGQTVADDLLGIIFSRFCIGK